MGAITAIFMTILSLSYAFSAIQVIFSTQGRLMIFEACLLASFLFLTIAILKGIYQKKNWAWTLSAYTFAIMFANAGYLYFKTDMPLWYSMMFILTAVGFVYSIMRIRSYEEYEYLKLRKKVKKGVSGNEVIVEEIKPLKEDELLKSYKKEFVPGKFVASKTGTMYHTPKCEWAKRIKKSNRVWFNTHQEAKKAGYKKHSCLK